MLLAHTFWENTQSRPSVLIAISVINYIWIYVPKVTAKEGSNSIIRNNKFFAQSYSKKMLVKSGTRLLNTLWVFEYFKVKVKVSNLVLDIFSSSYNEDLTTLFRDLENVIMPYTDYYLEIY